MDGTITKPQPPKPSGELVARAAGNGPSVGNRAPRAVLVEDDAMVRLVTADLIADLGYEVDVHATGQGAMAALRAARADLLVTDIGLPDMDGMEVARQAMVLNPGLATVIASGASGEAGGDFVFLEKPYDTRRLRAAIARAIDRARETAARAT